MSPHLGERQRRLDALHRTLKLTRVRAASALATARILEESDENFDRGPSRELTRTKAKQARLRWRELLARIRELERILDTLALSLAKRPPLSQRSRTEQTNRELVTTITSGK